jgi:hypothetical protein
MARACACEDVSDAMGVFGREKEVAGKCTCKGRWGSKEDRAGREVDFHHTRAGCAEPPMARIDGRWCDWCSFWRRVSRNKILQ